MLLKFFTTLVLLGILVQMVLLSEAMGNSRNQGARSSRTNRSSRNNQSGGRRGNSGNRRNSGGRGNGNNRGRGNPFETAIGVDEVNLEELAQTLREQLDSIVNGGITPASPFQFNGACNVDAEFRSITGVCNNLIKPLIGTTNTPQTRFVANRYDDGINSATTNFSNAYGLPGNPLPSARSISLSVHLTNSNLSSDHSHFLMNWGQFLDHEIILTPFLEGRSNVPPECCFDVFPLGFEECMPIFTPNDPVFVTDCIPFRRSDPTPGFSADPVERFQLNEVSSFIDASMVYGPNSENANSLRSFVGGLFLTEPRIDGQIGLPSDPLNPTNCNTVPPSCTFLAGDVRVTEQAALTSMHTLLVREHNRIATRLAALNRNWDDELLYQTTRKVVGAIVQRISFNEFLPIILGPRIMTKFGLTLLERGFFRSYDPMVDPATSTEFGAAAFRFGHSLIRQKFGVDESRQVDISVIFDSFNTVIKEGSNGLLNGLATDPTESLDSRISAGVRDRLFNEELDLASLNIQRGRDHGIGSYNDFRKLFNLETSDSYAFYSGNVFSVAASNALQAVYPSPNDIELFPGGLSEQALPGALMGETLASVLGRQFKRLRFGDRFWHETDDDNTGFTADQLAEIRKVTTATLFCENTDEQRQRPWIMKLDGPGNRPISCNQIPTIDFEPWKEDVSRRGRAAKRGRK